jgi:hypothetical protein
VAVALSPVPSFGLDRLRHHVRSAWPNSRRLFTDGPPDRAEVAGPASASQVRPGTNPVTGPRLLLHDERTHHAVLFVREYVAAPHVLMAPVRGRAAIAVGARGIVTRFTAVVTSPGSICTISLHANPFGPGLARDGLPVREARTVAGFR